MRLRVATRRAGAWLVINGHAGVARDIGADGVHLGGGAGSVAAARAAIGRPAWVSIAAHSDEDVRRAGDEGADAVLVSPIFATRPPTATVGRGAAANETVGRGAAANETGWLAAEKPPRGLDALRRARAIARPDMAVFALGGITFDRVRACAEAGADGVAVLRALLANPRPAVVARAINDVLAQR
jgi:thiamine-phosphate pyrophosphorylase